MSATVLDGAWDLSPADRLIVEAKPWGSRLRFAVMLLFYRARGRFPRDAAAVDKDAVADLAHRLGMPAPGSRAALLPASEDRTLKRQRAEIRALLGFREATIADAEDLGLWLRDTVVPRVRDMGELTTEAEARCRRSGSSRPAPTMLPLHVASGSLGDRVTTMRLLREFLSAGRWHGDDTGQLVG